MTSMQVDRPEHGPHDHAFGTGAQGPDGHAVEPAEHHTAPDGTAMHGLPESVEAHGGVAAAFGGHIGVGHLEHDFSDHALHGLEGLHDSVHDAGGLGGDEHHTLHDDLHHDLHADPQHDVAHDVAHDPAHHDIGHLFH